MEEDNVKVIVRIRPIQSVERKNGDIPCVSATADGREVQVKVGPLDAQVYKCNKCFSTESTQAEFFAESGITELLDSAIQGYRACAFAFGQTGAGKTFTMVGPTKGINHRDKQVGMIARSLEYTFNKVNMLNAKHSIKIACLEIYHEHVYDLFAEERERVSLAVREHSSEEFFLEGCKMVECADYEIACGALDVAMRNRQTGGHDMNNRSSRSHCLTEIYVEAKGDNDQVLSRGRMSLVDLAGSERLKSTNSTGKVLQEAGFINRSLYVLGKVIAGLVRTSGDVNHKDVPYRDSKLTKLLISSLNGRSHTLLISCVSEAKGSQAETLRTLKFSMSCARIRNKPVKFLDPHDKLILDLRDEIKRLRHENKKLRSTMVTAPASGEKGGVAQFSDDEPSSARQHRALSAHSSLAARKVGRKSPAKKSKKAVAASPHKLRSSQSEFFAEYGQRIKSLSPAKKAAAQRSMSTVDRTLFPTEEQEEDDALSYLDQEEERSLGSQSSSATRRKVTQAEMDDIVRRHAVGPMVFRGKEAILPLRDTRGGLAPANNYERGMETDRLAQLERRLALMEQSVMGQSTDSISRSPNGGDHATAAPVELSANQIVVSADALVPKKKPKKKPAAPKKNKESPYIAHLKPDKPGKTGLPDIKRKPAEKPGASQAESKDIEPPRAKQSESVASLQAAIQAELEELGLVDAVPAAKAPVKAKSTTSTTRAAKPAPAKSERLLPAIKPDSSQGADKKASVHPVKKAEKLPDVGPQQKQQRLSREKDSSAKSSVLVASPVKAKESPAPSPAVAQAKKKLEVLERSLTAQQIEMEDNPGEATTEREEQLAAMQSQAKDMRMELEIAAGGRLGEYGEDGFEEEDEFEPPQAVSVGVKGEIKDLRELTVDVLEHSGSSQDPPTPLAVRQMALALEEINSSSVAAAQNRSSNSTAAGRAASRGRPRTGGEDEYGYGEEDFEAEFEEVVDAASSQRLFAETGSKTESSDTKKVEPGSSTDTHSAKAAVQFSGKSSAADDGESKAEVTSSPYQSPTTHIASPTASERHEAEPTVAEAADADGYEDEFDAEEETETEAIQQVATKSKPTAVAAPSNQQEEQESPAVPVVAAGEEEGNYGAEDFDEYDMSFEAE